MCRSVPHRDTASRRMRNLAGARLGNRDLAQLRAGFGLRLNEGAHPAGNVKVDRGRGGDHRGRLRWGCPGRCRRQLPCAARRPDRDRSPRVDCATPPRDRSGAGADPVRRWCPSGHFGQAQRVARKRAAGEPSGAWPSSSVTGFRQAADPLDLDPDQVSRHQEGGRIAEDAHSARRAHGDDVAGSRVTSRLIMETIAGTSKIRSSVLPSCMASGSSLSWPGSAAADAGSPCAPAGGAASPAPAAGAIVV